MHSCTCILTHTYINTHAHTYTYKQTYTCLSLALIDLSFPSGELLLLLLLLLSPDIIVIVKSERPPAELPGRPSDPQPQTSSSAYFQGSASRLLAKLNAFLDAWPQNLHSGKPDTRNSDDIVPLDTQVRGSPDRKGVT